MLDKKRNASLFALVKRGTRQQEIFILLPLCHLTIAFCEPPDSFQQVLTLQVIRHFLIAFFYCLDSLAMSLNISALSVFSHGRATSVRPKCPYAAVCL